MADIKREELEQINSDLIEDWKEYEKLINDIESIKPEFKNEYDKKSDYTNYVMKKGFYAGVTFAQGKFEEFLDKHK